MSKYYIFEAHAGAGIAVTDDRTGAKIPGAWFYFDEIELVPGQKTVAGEADQIIASIERFGFFLWPPVAPRPTRKT